MIPGKMIDISEGKLLDINKRKMASCEEIIFSVPSSLENGVFKRNYDKIFFLDKSIRLKVALPQLITTFAHTETILNLNGIAVKRRISGMIDHISEFCLPPRQSRSTK